MDKNKEAIISNFIQNVKGKKYDSTGFNNRHDGAEGHWLERQMGIAANANNEPDLLGYEMKKDTKSKTTFGDWSPDIALWKKVTPYPDIPRIDRDTEFLKFFGKPNLKKKGRLSWSGEPVPTIKGYNSFGQILKVDQDENILACYSYSHDQRPDKSTLLPEHFKRDDLIIAKWLKDVLMQKVERKFNDKGWFKCFKDTTGTYTHIGFGDPIKYSDWIELVKIGIVFYDSGMYAGNVRPYAQWRANNNYWDALITEKYSEES